MRALTIEPVERMNLTLSAGAVAASWLLVTPAFALSLAVGAALETVNFRGLFGSAEAMLLGDESGWKAGFGLRFALLAVGIGLAIYAGAHPVGLVIGLSLIIPAAILAAWRACPPIDPDAPVLAPEDEAWERWNPWLAREREEEEGER